MRVQKSEKKRRKKNKKILYAIKRKFDESIEAEKNSDGGLFDGS